MDRKAIILKEMAYDEDQEFKNLFDKAKMLIKIRQNNVTPFILHIDKLSDGQKITCFLLGKYYHKEAEFSDTSISTSEEISKALKIDKQVINARLKELVDEDIVERVSRGNYKISFINLESYLDNIISKINKN